MAILLGIWLAVRSSSGDQNKPQSKPSTSTQSKQTTSNQQVQQLVPSATKPQASTAAAKSGPPSFTVYYPSAAPPGLSLDKSSIAYSPDSFTFAAAQNGENQFFIYEQPAGNNFSYQRLKVRLGSPLDADTSLGKGIIGTIGTNLVTAVNTDKNTLIILNCTALACAAPSKQIIDSLKVNTDPTHIH